jgi:hypothetical protein
MLLQKCASVSKSLKIYIYLKKNCAGYRCYTPKCLSIDLPQSSILNTFHFQWHVCFQNKILLAECITSSAVYDERGFWYYTVVRSVLFFWFGHFIYTVFDHIPGNQLFTLRFLIVYIYMCVCIWALDWTNIKNNL